jgi:hypothetical protein
VEEDAVSMYLSNDDAEEPGAEIAEFVEAELPPQDEAPVDPTRRPTGSLPLPPSSPDAESDSSASAMSTGERPTEGED